MAENLSLVQNIVAKVKGAIRIPGLPSAKARNKTINNLWYLMVYNPTDDTTYRTELGDMPIPGGVGNEAKFGVKFVRGITEEQAGTNPDTGQPYESRDRLPTEALCLQAICYSEFAPTEEEKITKLVYDEQGPLSVYVDGSFSGAKINAKWVPITSQDAANAGIQAFDQFNEVGYVPRINGRPASLVSHPIQDVVRFFNAIVPLVYEQGGEPIPAPTGTGADANWREASPPNVVYAPTTRIAWNALVSRFEDEQMPEGKLCQIYGRLNGEPDVYATFDEVYSRFSEGARVAGMPGLFRYDLAFDEATPIVSGGELTTAALLNKIQDGGYSEIYAEENAGKALYVIRNNAVVFDKLSASARTQAILVNGISGAIRGTYENHAAADIYFQPNDSIFLMGNQGSITITKSGNYYGNAAYFSGISVASAGPLNVKILGGTFGGRVVVDNPSGEVGHNITIENLRGASQVAYFELFSLFPTGGAITRVHLIKCSANSGFSEVNGAGAVLLRQRNDAPANSCLLTVEDCNFGSVFNSVFSGTAHVATRIEFRGLNNIFTPAAGKPLQNISRINVAGTLPNADILIDNRGARLISATGAVGLLTYDGANVLLNGSALGGGATGPTGPPAGFTGAIAPGDGTWLVVNFGDPGLTLIGPWLPDGGAMYLAGGSTGSAPLEFYGKQAEVYGTRFGGGGTAEAKHNDVRRATISTAQGSAEVGVLLYTFPLGTVDGVHIDSVSRTGESGTFIITHYRIR